MKNSPPFSFYRTACLHWRLSLSLVFAFPALPVMRASQPPAVEGARTQVSEIRQSKKHPIVWDAMKKTVATKPGENKADFVFTATNTSDDNVTIDDVTPGCACTITEMPEKPWVLAPGKGGDLHAKVDLVGKTGSLTNTLLIH